MVRNGILDLEDVFVLLTFNGMDNGVKEDEIVQEIGYGMKLINNVFVQGKIIGMVLNAKKLLSVVVERDGILKLLNVNAPIILI